MPTSKTSFYDEIYSENLYLGLGKLVHTLAANFHIFAILLYLQGNVNDVNRFFFLSRTRLKKKKYKY